MNKTTILLLPFLLFLTALSYLSHSTLSSLIFNFSVALSVKTEGEFASHWTFYSIKACV